MLRFESGAMKSAEVSVRTLASAGRLLFSIALLIAGAFFASDSNVEAADSAAPLTGVKNLSVKIDPCSLFKTTHLTVVPKTANHSDEPPFMNGEPEHISVLFDSDKPKNYDPESQRQLLVYPLPSYAVLFKGKEKIAFEKSQAVLKKVISTKSDRGVKEIPALPAAEAFQVFHNHVKYLPFKQGSGVVFLTSYAQDEAPIENGHIFYTYQGISGDGKYYVSLTYPVTAPKLPARAPAKAGVNYLNTLSDEKFTPSLAEIDKLIQSISVK